MKTFLTSAAMALVLATPALAEYPEKTIQGIIQWGAGGSTDTVMRAVSPFAEEVLGEDIVLTNRTGGVGAIATKFAMTQQADGYTLLMGAENPQIYKVMGLGDVDYNDFVPINILARGVPMLVAAPDAPYNTFEELIAYIQENPGEVRFGSTGPGGLASVVSAMITTQIEGVDVTTVPYDGDGPALTALMGGAIDVMPAVLGAAIENIKAGRMKPLVVFEPEANEVLPDTPAIVDTHPEFGKYLPWGPFFGVFTKNGTPDEAVAKLTEAFHAGAQAEEFQTLLENRGYELMDLSGDEAREFLNQWQSTTAWLIDEAGLAKVSPEEFDIPKPE
ncbi:Bug family tripartite tricarboxylate transporter substrate binding protein [Paracoccaceae bacterium GXU_MW_L88]